MITRLAVVWAVVVVCVSAVGADAQWNPYNPPFPGAVPIQPCGEEPGWVPADHPLAGIGMCVPPPVTPTADQPWTLAPDLPMEVGRVYRDPYGLVIEVVSATVSYRRGAAGAVVPTVLAVDALLYQSRWHYEQRAGAVSMAVDLSAPRRQWWEVEAAAGR